MAKEGDHAWSVRFRATAEAAKKATTEEVNDRDAKTARLKQARLAAEADKAPGAKPLPSSTSDDIDEGDEEQIEEIDGKL